ncbi:MAG: FAD-dependent oxidoreductase [Kordiimonas sp.]|nr:FAD-dependent oxidoreductase [Kordiimonas sp.]|tara:strand:+ start:9900 stop:11024 length:1125 start_codon:yes stop_codon:yes gene_type:complete
MQKCDFLIIGAGIAGASAGYFLSPHGRTIILEREDVPGYHTTGRSAAFYAETYGNAIIQRLTTASKKFFFHPPEGFSSVPLVSGRGALYVLSTGQEDLWKSTLADMQARVPAVYAMTADEVLACVPSLRRERIIGGIMDPDCQDIDVHAVHQGYLSGLRQQGGRVVTSADVRGLHQLDDSWVVKTAAGDFYAKNIINAAGAWGDEIAQKAGVEPLGLLPKRRTIIVCPVSGGMVNRDMPLTLNIPETLYFKPEGEGLLVSPADESPSAPCDAQPEEFDVALTVDRLQQSTAYEVDQVTRKWAGLRTFLTDRTPVAGYDAAASGFFWCVGQGGYGIQTSPAIGMFVAGLITEGKVPDYLAAHGITAETLSPGRFV